MKSSIIASFALLLTCSLAMAQKVGDRVDAWVSGGTYPGKIIEVGTGSYAGYYLVKFDSGTQQYVKKSNLTIRSGKGEKTVPAVAPRSGRYVILSYTNPSSPIRIGYVTLSGKTYDYRTMAGRPAGTGHCRFDSASKSVKWLDGPFKSSSYTGAFRVERDGKTHVIQLNRVTIASNSTDTANR